MTDEWWFDSWQGQEFFLFSKIYRLVHGPTQPPIQWVWPALSMRLKQMGSENEHSPPFSAEFENAWSYANTGTALPLPVVEERGWMDSDDVMAYEDNGISHRSENIFMCTVI
jgi:hypothetical protein